MLTGTCVSNIKLSMQLKRQPAWEPGAEFRQGQGSQGSHSCTARLSGGVDSAENLGEAAGGSLWFLPAPASNGNFLAQPRE